MRATRGFETAVGMLLLALWAGANLQPVHGAEESYAGTWKGTWEGAGSSGSFDVALTRGAEGWSGSVAVGTNMGNYTAPFSKANFSANDFSATYDYPPDPTGEVTLAGKFDPKKATGTWALGPKNSPGQALASGTWSVARR